MYTTCIFCHDLLGTNDHIEHFPVGRRLAFDSVKGRLWVVCQRCAQWNLAPLEERWEAVEDCERAFRAVRTRVSTAEIGLARLADGMDLVRVGAPLRPEFAAGRFGDQLGARRRKNILRLVGGSAILGGGGMIIAGLAGALVLPLVGPGLVVGGAIAAATGLAGPRPYAIVRPLRVSTDDGTYIELGRDDLLDIEMRAKDGPAGFQLSMDVAERFPMGNRQETRHVTISGAEAVRAARLLLPRINGGGASRKTVQEAVSAIDDAGSAERFIPRALDAVRKSGRAYSPIWSYPPAVRLGIEMALHEEAERRVMAGELSELESAWREAERVATIADDLLLPPQVSVFMEKHRKRR